MSARIWPWIGFSLLAAGGLVLFGLIEETRDRMAHLELIHVAPQVVSTLRQDLKQFGEEQDRLRDTALDLNARLQTLDQQHQEQDRRLDSLEAAITAIKERAAGNVSQEQLAALSAEVDRLGDELKQTQRRIVPMVTRPAPAKVSKRRSKPAPPPVPTPSFTALGIEVRGGERFLAVSPAGSSALSQVRLLGVGDRLGSWQLRTLEKVSAEFLVDGHGPHTLMLP